MVIGPESYVDYSIRVKVESQGVFETHLALGPEHEILESRHFQYEESWQRELIELKDLIQAAKDALSQKNQVALRGFYQIAKIEFDYFKHKKMSFENFEEFIGETIGIFSSAHEAYSTKERRPAYNLGKSDRTFSYHRLDKNLNPREVRLLINGFGLNGTKLTLDELGKSEGLVSTKSNTNVAATLTSALNHLVWNYKKSS